MNTCLPCKSRWIFLFLLLTVSGSLSGQTALLDTIRNRINADLHNFGSIASLDSRVTADKATLINNDSAWSDVNYTTGDGNHLSRLQNFALAYTTSGSSYYGDNVLQAIITKGLAYWYRRNPVNSNWYHNIIAFPQGIGRILIIMRYGNTPLPATVENNLLASINKGMAGHTNVQAGSNESDVALHYIYRATLTLNSTVMDTAFLHAFRGIAFTTGGDGVSYDNCYVAHNGQLGVYSYGHVFINNAFVMASYLRNTPWALTASKLMILVDLYRNTYLKAERNGYSDFNTRGRGISRGSGLDNSRTTGISTTFLPLARLVDPAHNAIWDSVANGRWHNKPLHTHYWRADYDIHRRNGYAFHVHTVSSRTRRTERGNGENLLGKFLPDGATGIQRWGGEYKNIFPIWEWDKIPGVTSRDFSTDAGSAMSVDWGETGSGTFTGGVSDGLYGASVYNMSYNGVAAKKSWFFFDGEVVCLGAGITSAQTEPVATTVNQAWLYNNITVSNGGSVTTIDNNANTVTSYSSPQWVLHDSIGYFFPSGGSLSVSNQTQSGSWNRINTGYSSTALSGKVFKLWLGHGAQPSGAKYAYIVAPGKTSTADMNSYRLSDIRIVANTDSVQAVRHLGLDIMQVVFYKAGTLRDSSISITVDKPCVIELRNLHNAQVALYAADPGQQQSNIIIGLELPALGGVKQISVNLPQAPYAGSTAAYTVDDNTQLPATDTLHALADAYVRDGSYAGTNYGAATGLPVKKDGAGYTREAYFKFELPDREIVNGRLRLYSVGGNTTAGSTQWQLWKVDNSSWTESGITWNNKPARSTLLATLPGNTAAGYYYWDITSYLQGLQPGTFSLALTSAVTGATTDATFSSREASAANRPAVILQYEAAGQAAPVIAQLISAGAQCASGESALNR